jgi:hypothetical protein
METLGDLRGAASAEKSTKPLPWAGHTSHRAVSCVRGGERDEGLPPNDRKGARSRAHRRWREGSSGQKNWCFFPTAEAWCESGCRWQPGHAVEWLFSYFTGARLCRG